MAPEDDKRFAFAVAALLAVMAAAMFDSARRENDTYDEGGHLVAGYAYLTIQDYGFNAEHPPLGNILSALPLLAVKPRLPSEHPAWRGRAAPIAGALFLYRNRIGPDRLLMLGRAVTMTFALLLGLILALWARRRFGAAAALLALFLYATDPNFTAHGHYITTDLFAAFFIFAACLAWQRQLESGQTRDLIFAGLLAGAALAVKFSAFVLLPIYFLLDLVHRRRVRLRSITTLAVAAALALAIVGLSYWSETGRLLQGDLPASRHSFVLGLTYLAEHNRQGRPAYLLGQVSEQGWWYYFPVAIAVKTPAAVLLLGLVAPFAAGRRLRRPAVLLVPPLVYLAAAMAGNLNLGIRHLLPVYPFLFALIAAAFDSARWSRRTRLALLATAVCLQLAEWSRSHPHHLAFFNSLAGGSANGWKYLADSNLDWGQDVKHLRRYLERRGIDEVCLAYFGTTDVAYHGVRRRQLPTTREVETGGPPDCVAAISMNLLLGLYVDPGSYDWLRRFEPDGIAGRSIRVYDLRRPAMRSPQKPRRSPAVAHAPGV